MEFVKKLCVVVVLAALSYGAYATLTTRPPADPPPEAADAVAPTIEAPSIAAPPSVGGASPSSLGSGPSSAAPAFHPSTAGAAPAFNPSAAGGAPPFKPASNPTPSPSSPPAAWPNTTNSSPLTPDSGASTTPPAPLPGNSIGTTDDGAAPIAVVTGIDTDPSHLDPMAEFRVDYVKAQDYLRQSDLAGALRQLSPWCDDSRLPEIEREALLDLLDQLAGTVVYSREYDLESPCIVQPGETLETIAQRYDVPWKLLANINGYTDPQEVKAGDRLKVLHGPFNALVNLKNHELTLLVGGLYAGRFPIGVGSDVGPEIGTSEQQFKVQQMAQRTPYYGQSAVIDADDPGNPLGGYWIDLGKKIGIHGTHDDRLVGRDEGQGAIRLSRRDIQDVFHILSDDSEVLIRR